MLELSGVSTLSVVKYLTMDDHSPAQESVEIPIDGTLDLHTFQASEIRELVPAYLEACRERDILSVRIVHGKGTGTLREIVRSVLKKLPFVLDFRLADETAGSWGATWVTLKKI
ncbi:MAG TPA: Smr/MutS family protein [Dissulfurispiraceae bacterium]|nr:Smr/MutS family protein [Dissulfurispiraceae bacterium]